MIVATGEHLGKDAQTSHLNFFGFLSCEARSRANERKLGGRIRTRHTLNLHVKWLCEPALSITADPAADPLDVRGYLTLRGLYDECRLRSASDFLFESRSAEALPKHIADQTSPREVPFLAYDPRV